jgi:hypothetical protein
MADHYGTHLTEKQAAYSAGCADAADERKTRRDEKFQGDPANLDRHFEWPSAKRV